uniref:Uncharacterized protein n=1 Tax=Arundo donax TaxID=35708 RepID=A0A0A9BQ06_ARUDO
MDASLVRETYAAGW